MKIRLFTLPNIITLANLACGCAASVMALSYGDIKKAFLFIATAGILDFLDGMAARLTGQYSEAGKQLDSLADLVSFGFAPAAILYVMMTVPSGWPLWSAGPVFLLTLFSALRLAKFNVDTRQSTEFRGLPTPASALFVAAWGWSFADGTLPAPVWVIFCTTAVLCLLLISDVRLFSLKFGGFGWHGNSLRYIFLAGSVALLALLGVPGVMGVIAAYILVSLIRNAVCRRPGASAAGKGDY